jgi:hypothetical protein
VISYVDAVNGYSNECMVDDQRRFPIISLHNFDFRRVLNLMMIWLHFSKGGGCELIGSVNVLKEVWFGSA